MTFSFEELLEASVMETLTKVLGEIVWKAIGFYFEAKALSRDPEALRATLDRLFGRNAAVIEKEIADHLMAKVGVPEEKRKESLDFRSVIRIAKTKFVSTGSASQVASTTLEPGALQNS